MKNVLITGGAKNTGFAVARRFAQAGYCVAITSRSAADATQAAKRIAGEFGVPAVGYEMALSSCESIAAVFQNVEKVFGGLSAFVANAAELGRNNTVASTTEDDYYRVTDVNIKGTFFCCKEAALLMKRHGGGSIVTIGSVQGEGAVPGRALYSLSKAAVSSLVKTLAYEFGEYGIRANNLVAGAIRTARWDGMTEEELAKKRSAYPAGRESSEEDIAEAVFFLGSDLSPTVTGASLTVDSGLCACVVPYEKQNP